MNTNRTFFLESLGCAKNLVDSEVMLGCLLNEGYELVSAVEEAAIIIVNTCSFIEDATRESLDTILEFAELKQTGACTHLVVCGCLPQRYKDELLQELPEVDLFLGAGGFQNIAAHLQALADNTVSKRLVADRPAFLLTDKTPRMLSVPGGSAYIKIAEGCSHHCTYCTIPSIKGPYRRRSSASIVKEARQLSADGIGEINLVAQDTTRYEGLDGLLKKLVAIKDLTWVRLLYCHPRHLTPDIIRLMAGEEKLCRYIDIPLQHIADPVLKKMGRRITRKKTEALISSIRRICPDIALRTTFIVGFPGETERDFEALLSFAEDTGFDHLGAFQYRDEEGTPASRLPDKIPEKVKKERYNLLMRGQADISRKKNSRFKGREIQVLVEGISANEHYNLQARTEFQAPEIDGVVYLKEPVTIGSFQRVKITRTLTYDLVGRVLEDSTE